MRQIELIFLLIVLSITNISAQELSLKEQALKEFKNEHYDKAIELLENALKISTEDAEIYYYLGYFNHYRDHTTVAL
ncbi:MAG: tetratricopeptide repeat protein [Lutibacter sp.]